MSYSEFVSFFGNAFTLLIQGLTEWGNALVHNYYFITILGTVLFCSLVLWAFTSLKHLLYKPIDRIEYKLDKYNNYDLYQDIKYDWFCNHRQEVYERNFDYLTVNKNVASMYENYKNKNSKKDKKNYKKKSKNNSNTPSEPYWLAKDIIGEPLTPEEEAELTDVLDNF